MWNVGRTRIARSRITELSRIEPWKLTIDAAVLGRPAVAMTWIADLLEMRSAANVSSSYDAWRPRKAL